jgi:hypothetical protein
MKIFQKEQHNSLASMALIGVCAALVLFAMFNPHKLVERYAPSVDVRYIYAAQDINLTLSSGIRLMLLGLFSGILGGMMGMAGGVVKASGLLIIFGMEVVLVRSIALMTNVFIYGSASYRYMKTKGLVMKNITELMVPGAILGTAFGFLIGLVLHSGWLKMLLGLFALHSGLDMLRRIYGGDNLIDAPLSEYEGKGFRTQNKIRIAGAGFPMGLVMGLFGISGGILGVPYQRYILRIPIKNAIANTTVTSYTASIVALIVSLWYEYNYGQYGITTPIVISLCIIPGNIVGGNIGAYLTHVLPIKFINLSYVVIMLVIGIKLFF